MLKKIVKSLVALLPVLVFAQVGELPTDGLVGHWTFDDASNLEKATVGNDLVRDTVYATADIDGFSSVSGPTTDNKAVNVLTGSFYRCEHNIFPNGYDPNYPDSTASRINQYTLVYDFHIPQTGVWYAFHDVNNNGSPTSDWDCFIKPAGVLGLGTGGYSFYEVDDTEGWYRLVIVADLGVQYTYYLDGQILQDASPRSIDDRFSLDSPFNSNSIIFFGDNDGEDAPIDIAELALYERALTLEEIEALGGYGHDIPFGSPFGQWNFSDSDAMETAEQGTDLDIQGDNSVVQGPAIGGYALEVSSGAYLGATHNIKANGYADEAQKVNKYTVSMDIKIDQVMTKYSLLQTSTSNSDDADIMIDEIGRIGSDSFGWSDTSHFKFKTGDWYRVTFAVSQGDTSNNFVMVIDKDSIFSVSSIASDGPLALEPKEGDNKVLFFADNDGDDAPIQVGKLRIWNYAMSVSDMAELGEFEHTSEYEPPVADNMVFKYDGQSAYGLVTNDLTQATMPTRDMTVECWVNISKGVDWTGFIGAFQDNGSYEKGWVLGARYEANPTFSIGLSTMGAGPDAGDDNGSMDYMTALSPVNLDEWNHVAATYDGDTTKIYVNGILLNQMVTQSGDIYYDDASYFSVGVYYDENEFFVTNGYQDEIRLWNVELSEETIQNWMHKKITSDHPNYNDMISYWTFDNLNGSVAPDEKGDNDLTMYNMPSSSYLVSSAPIGDDGQFVMDNETVAVGDDGAEVKVTITGDVDIANNLGLFTVGEKDDAKVEGELYAGDLNMRSSVYYGVYENGEVTAKLEFVYSGISNIPTDGSSLFLVYREDAYDAWVVVDDATQSAGEFIIEGSVEPGEYAIAWSGNPSSVETGATAEVFSLSQNYPNPFNPTTNIRYSIPKISDVKITIYNTLGQRVEVITHVKQQSAGVYDVKWNAGNLSSGLYFYSIEAGDFRMTKKLMLLK